MKIVGIIPCRYGSKRYEGKPIKPILGKPMIQWVYERAKQSELLTEIVIATDDERIRTVVEGFGGTVVMTAPIHRSGSDRVAEAADDDPGSGASDLSVLASWGAGEPSQPGVGV